jgi:predicted phage-related endonuclease
VSDAERRQAWLAARLEHITSTDLANIMRLPDAYGTPMSTWLEKKQLLERAEVPDWMTWGIRLQTPIIEAAADRLALPVEHADPWALEVCPEHQVVAASLDARVLDGAERPPLDAKNVGWLKPTEWGEDGSDMVPPRFVVQLHAQMVCTGASSSYLAVLFGGRNFRLYCLQRDPEIAGAIVDVAEDFWTRHVLADVPPPVDGSDEWARFLARRAQESEAIVDSSPELDRWVEQLRQARAALEQAEALEKEARNHLADAIGSAAGLKGPWGRISYKRTKDGSKVDWEAVAQELLPHVGAAGKSLVEKFTTTKPGYRVFRPTFKEQA